MLSLLRTPLKLAAEEGEVQVDAALRELLEGEAVITEASIRELVARQDTVIQRLITDASIGQLLLHVFVTVQAELGVVDLPEWCVRLADQGIAIESTVDWPAGGKSIYFRDPDEHLLELATPGIWPNY